MYNYHIQTCIPCISHTHSRQCAVCFVEDNIESNISLHGISWAVTAVDRDFSILPGAMRLGTGPDNSSL